MPPACRASTCGARSLDLLLVQALTRSDVATGLYGAAIGHAWAVPRLGAEGAALVTLALAACCMVAVIHSALRLRAIEGAGRGVAVAAAVAGLALAASVALAPAGWTVVPAALATGIAGAAVLVAAGVVPAAELAGLRRTGGRTP